MDSILNLLFKGYLRHEILIRIASSQTIKNKQDYLDSYAIINFKLISYPVSWQAPAIKANSLVF